jgi:multiple sugar transport system permease protein
MLGKKKLNIGNGLRITLIIVVAIICITPFLWMLMSAFKTRTEIMSPVLRLVFKPTLANFRDAFFEGGFTIYLMNSLIIGAGTVLLCLLIGVPAAYTFSRFHVYGKKHLYFFILTTRMAPGVAVALPL